MRSGRGSRTSQSSATGNSASDGSKNGRSKRTKSGTGSNSTLEKTDASKKPGREKNKDIVDIQPLVYSFRVPSNPSPGSVMNALLPPYWLYHDHAFGVIWMLFHPDKKYVGIAQLHWCLRFLLDLKNTESEYTGDVNVCIQAVQDDLIEQYAKLGEALENEEASKSGARETSRVSKDGEDDEGPEKEQGNESSSPSVRPREDKNRNVESGGSSPSVEKGGNVSLTYNEMMSRGPTPYTEQTPLEQIYRAGVPATIPDDAVTSTPDITTLLTPDNSPPDVPLTDMGTEELVNFLNVSRMEQVQRIKKDIERLHDLEKFLEGVDKQGFKGLIKGDLARRLDKLDGVDVVREVETMLK